MNREFWLKRWQDREIGWHENEAEPALVRSFQGKAPMRFFVPLCGKSLDLAWLGEHGHEVLGVELSPLACREFFAERKLTPEVRPDGPFTRYEAGPYVILQGDFFALTTEHVGSFDVLYDRAALIALPPATRDAYASALRRWITASGSRFKEMLQVILERTPASEDGPPFSVTEQELQRHYAAILEIQRLSQGEEVPIGPGGRFRAIESVYRLIPRVQAPRRNTANTLTP